MKKLVATVAALAFAASLTACGEAGEKAAEETTEEADATGNAMEAGAENAMTSAEDAADATAEAADEAEAVELARLLFEAADQQHLAVEFEHLRVAGGVTLFRFERVLKRMEQKIAVIRAVRGWFCRLFGQGRIPHFGALMGRRSASLSYRQGEGCHATPSRSGKCNTHTKSGEPSRMTELSLRA